MELIKKDIDLGLASLLPHYPETGHNAATLRALSSDWIELLMGENVTLEEFASAIHRAKLKCKFFPKVADIMEFVQYSREHPIASKSVQISNESYAQLTDEEIERNKKRIRVILDQLAGKITKEASEKMMQEIV